MAIIRKSPAPEYSVPPMWYSTVSGNYFRTQAEADADEVRVMQRPEYIAEQQRISDIANLQSQILGQWKQLGVPSIGGGLSIEDRAQGLAERLYANQITDLKKLGLGTGSVRTPYQAYIGEAGDGAIYETRYEDAPANYLTYDGRQIGFLGDVGDAANWQPSGYLQPGDLASWSSAGKGAVSYIAKKAPNGQIYFIPSWGSTSSLAGLAPILSIASLIPSPLQPVAAAVNAAIAIDQGNVLGGLASLAGIPGVSDAIGSGLTSALTTANQAVNLEKAIESGDLLGAISAGANLTGTGGTQLGDTGVNVADATRMGATVQALESGDIAKALANVSAISDVKNTVIPGSNGVTLADALKMAGIGTAVASGDPTAMFKAIAAATNSPSLQQAANNAALGDWNELAPNAPAGGDSEDVLLGGEGSDALDQPLDTSLDVEGALQGIQDVLDYTATHPGEQTAKSNYAGEFTGMVYDPTYIDTEGNTGAYRPTEGDGASGTIATVPTEAEAENAASDIADILAPYEVAQETPTEPSNEVTPDDVQSLIDAGLTPDQVQAIVSDAGYTLPEDVANMISGATEGLATQEDVTSAVNTATEGLATKQDVQDAIDGIEFPQGVTEDDVSAIVEKAFADNPGLSAEDVSKIVQDALDQLPAAPTTEDIQGLIESGTEGLRNNVDQLAESLGTTKDALLEQLGMTEGELSAQIEAQGADFAKQLAEQGTQLGEQISGVQEDLTGKYDALSEAQKQLANDLQDTGVSLKDAIDLASQSSAEALAGVKEELTGQIGQLSADTTEKYNALTDAQKQLANDLADQGVDLQTAIDHAAATSAEALQTGLAGLETKFQTMYDAANADTQSRFDALSDNQKALAASLASSTGDLQAAIDKAAQNTSDMFANLQETFGGQLQDFQATVDQRVAELQQQGLTQQQAIDKVNAELTGMASDLGAQIGNVQSGLNTQIGNVQSGLQQQIGNVQSGLQQQVSNVQNTLQSQIAQQGNQQNLMNLLMLAGVADAGSQQAQQPIQTPLADVKSFEELGFGDLFGSKLQFSEGGSIDDLLNTLRG